MTGGPRNCDFLALWEAGATDHPLDRALGLIATFELTPRADMAAHTIDRRDRALFRISECLFGDKIRLFAACPDCADEAELSFSTHDALAVPAPAERFVLNYGAVQIACRQPTSRDLAMALAAPDPQRALLNSVIEAPNPDPELVLVAEQVLSDQGGLTDLNLQHHCDGCGSDSATPFDILDYLWRRITAEAQRLMRDVHVIARAYGWSSEAILALTPRRRAAHIALIEG